MKRTVSEEPSSDSAKVQKKFKKNKNNDNDDGDNCEIETTGEVHYTDPHTGNKFYTEIGFGGMTLKLGDCLRANLEYEKGARYHTGTQMKYLQWKNYKKVLMSVSSSSMVTP